MSIATPPPSILSLRLHLQGVLIPNVNNLGLSAEHILAIQAAPVLNSEVQTSISTYSLLFGVFNFSLTRKISTLILASRVVAPYRHVGMYVPGT
jgi:hypothetical protein